MTSNDASPSSRDVSWQRPRELCNVVFSAGNTLQLRAVAQMDILPENFGEIQWRVLPDDKTPNFVEIWLPTQGGDDQQRQQAEVSLVPPRDAPANIQPSRLGAAVEWRNGKDVAASLYHQRFPRPGGSRECVTIAIRPTADDREGAAVVPSGRWRIRVKNTTAQDLASASGCTAMMPGCSRAPARDSPTLRMRATRGLNPVPVA